MEKKKIAIVTTFMDRRPAKGTAVFIRKLVDHLGPYRDTFEFTLIHRESIPEDPVYTQYNEVILPRIRLPRLSHFFSELWFFLTTRARYDLIHFPIPRLQPSFIFAPAKTNLVQRYDGGPSTAEYPLPDTADSAGSIIWFLMRRFMKHFIVTSQFGWDGMVHQRHIAPEKVHRIYGGVDTSFTEFKGTKESAQQHLAKKYGITAPYLVASGRLCPHKNVHRLVEAIAILRDTYHCTIPVLVTGGEQIASYNEQVYAAMKHHNLQSQIRIFKVPDFEDMPQVYAGAEVMIFPSLYEGFGLPLLEAMACKTPVVASCISPFKEVGKDAVVFFDPLNPQDMAHQIHTVLNDKTLQQTLVTRALAIVPEYTWERHAAETIELYRKLTA